MFDGIGRARATDYFRIRDQLTEQERGYLDATRGSSTTRYFRSSTTTGSAPNSRAIWCESSARSASSVTASMATVART